MRILDNRSLSDLNVFISRAETCWELYTEDGVLIAQAANTAKLSRYAMDREGARTCVTKPWPGYSLLSDL